MYDCGALGGTLLPTADHSSLYRRTPSLFCRMGSWTDDPVVMLLKLAVLPVTELFRDEGAAFVGIGSSIFPRSVLVDVWLNLLSPPKKLLTLSEMLAERETFFCRDGCVSGTDGVGEVAVGAGSSSRC